MADGQGALQKIDALLKKIQYISGQEVSIKGDTTSLDNLKTALTSVSESFANDFSEASVKVKEHIENIQNFDAEGVLSVLETLSKELVGKFVKASNESK